MAANGAVKVSPDVPLDVACVIGCAVQTGVGAVLNTARVEEGASVLVMGLGGIGLSVVQGARLAGAARIVASDPVAGRREAAKALGATDFIDPSSEDVLAKTREIAPIGVVRESFFFACVTAAPFSQTVMLRNFQTRISRPSRPYRFCLKKTGPDDDRFTRAAMTIIGIANTHSSNPASAMSRTRLTIPSTP